MYLCALINTTQNKHGILISVNVLSALSAYKAEQELQVFKLQECIVVAKGKRIACHDASN